MWCVVGDARNVVGSLAESRGQPPGVGRGARGWRADRDAHRLRSQRDLEGMASQTAGRSRRTCTVAASARLVNDPDLDSVEPASHRREQRLEPNLASGVIQPSADGLAALADDCGYFLNRVAAAVYEP